MISRGHDFSDGFGPWLSQSGWTYLAFEKSAPPERFRHFEAFKQLWDSKCGEGRIPDWSDFEFAEFEPWWGFLCLEDIVPGDAYDTVFRLWGTNLVRMLDVELTGQSLRSTFDSAYSDYEIPMFERIRDQHILIVSHGPVYWRKSKLWDHSNHVAFFQLPLAADGINTDKVLSLVQPVTDKTDLPSHDA